MIIVIDQWVKLWLLATAEPGVAKPLIGDLVRLNLTFNDSAAFSLGFGLTWLFTLISSLAAAALIWYSRKIESVSWAIMAGVLLGGVCGNLIDRLTKEPGFPNGHVIDYLQIPFNFPIFNIADMAIVTICSLTVLRIMRGHQIGKITS